MSPVHRSITERENARADARLKEAAEREERVASDRSKDLRIKLLWWQSILIYLYMLGVSDLSETVLSRTVIDLIVAAAIIWLIGKLISRRYWRPARDARRRLETARLHRQ